MQKIARPSRGSQTKEVRSSTRLLSCHTLFTPWYIWHKSRQYRNRNAWNKYDQYICWGYLGVRVILCSLSWSSNTTTLYISFNLREHSINQQRLPIFSMDVFDGLVKGPLHGIHIFNVNMEQNPITYFIRLKDFSGLPIKLHSLPFSFPFQTLRST